MYSDREEYLQYLDEEMGGGVETPDGGTFTVTDDAAADWCCRKIDAARRRMAQRAAFVEAEIERLTNWQKAQDKRDQSTIDYMTGLLRPYFDRLRESGALGKSKSYKLPHGTLQARASGPKWARQDPAALLEWAKPLGLVRVKEEPAWSDIAKRLVAGERPGDPAVDGETGEIVPGVVLEVPAGETFTVKTDDPIDAA